MSVAIDIALNTILEADTGTGGVNHATTGATGGFHNRTAPQDAGLPRFEFRELLTSPLYTFTDLAADHVRYQIKAMAADTPLSEGVTIAGNLSERARVLLLDNDLGLGLLYCRFEYSIPVFEEWDEANHRYIYHNGFICELWQ